MSQSDLTTVALDKIATSQAVYRLFVTKVFLHSNAHPLFPTYETFPGEPLLEWQPKQQPKSLSPNNNWEDYDFHHPDSDLKPLLLILNIDIDGDPLKTLYIL